MSEFIIRISADEGFASNFGREVARMYRSGIFCDLDLVCRGGGAVSCHSVVLAAMSPFLADTLGQDGQEGEGGGRAIFLPDFEEDEVRRCLDDVYEFLDGGTDFLEENFDVYRALMVDLTFCDDPLDAMSPVSPPPESPQMFVKEEKEEDEKDGDKNDDDHDDDHDDHDGEEEEEEKVVKNIGLTSRKLRRTTRKRKGRSRLDGRRQPPKKRRRVPDEADAGLPQDMERVECQLRACGDDLVVTVGEDLDYREFCENPSKFRFVAAVGLKSPRGGDASALEALPLAWSAPATQPLGEQETARQYKLYCGALRSALGLSEVETSFQPAAVSRMEGASRKALECARRRRRRAYVNYTRDDLEAELLKEEVVAASRTAPQKTLPQQECMWYYGEERTLSLCADLPVRQLEGVALLLWDGDRERAEARLLRVGSEAREADAGRLTMLLFDVWLLRRPKGSRMEKCQEILDAVQECVVGPGLQFLAAREMLGEEGDRVRELFTGREMVCVDCGLVFKTATTQEYDKYTHHVATHKHHNFKCDCEVSLATWAEKERHIKLVHKAYLLCHQCDFLARNKTLLDGHIEREHEELTCQTCGEKIQAGQNGLNRHLADEHPEELSARLKKRMLVTSGICDDCGRSFDTPKQLHAHIENQHKVLSCTVCGEAVTGANQRRVHMRQKHRSLTETTCEQCGATVAIRHLQEHVLDMHTPESERPHGCPDCHRRFSTKSKLSTHRNLAHIRARRLKCRYDGCDRSYNDYGSRGNHERSKHGQTYHHAVKMGLMPPK